MEQAMGRNRLQVQITHSKSLLGKKHILLRKECSIIKDKMHKKMEVSYLNLLN